jgi:homogentisate 1,2-dioxygenase
MRFSDNGRMAYEELFGREGFSGPSSLIYHRNLPEGAKDVSEGPADLMTPEHEQVHTNAHLKGFDLPTQGDMITGRRWLLVNDDVHIGLVAPASAQQVLYVNGSADEVLFVHSGSGSLLSQFGHLAFKRHDYIVIPRGTIYRIDLDDLTDVRILCIEVTGLVDVPDRYRARNGQLTEIAPYSERDFHGPDALTSGEGPAEIWLKRANHVSRYVLDHHPWDVIGWDGTIYPVTFNIHDFEPRAGRFRPAADPSDLSGQQPGALLLRAAQARLGS